MITRFILGIDKLELTCQMANYSLANPQVNLLAICQATAEDRYIEGSFTLIRQHAKAGAMFRLSYEVFYESALYATLQAEYTMASATMDIVSLKIQNEFLYQPSMVDITREFLKTFDLEVRNVAAIDFYIDSRQDIRALFETYFYAPHLYHFVSRAYTSNDNDCKKITALDRYRTSEASGMTYYLGNLKRTGKQVCIYNKSKELADKAHKDYITEHHRENIEGKGDVYRFELRLTHKYLYKYSNQMKLDWEKCIDVNYIATVVSDNLDRFFDFRHMDKSEVKRCTRIQFFNFSNIKMLSLQWILNKPCQSNNNSSRKGIKSKQKVLSEMIDELYISRDDKKYEDIKQIAVLMGEFEFFHTKTRSYKLKRKPALPAFNDPFDLF